VRWEWRTFGDALGDAETRLRALTPERMQESDETYLVSGAVDHAVKAREGLMDIKQLEQVNRDGLELWRPVMKSPLPISPADARAVLLALGTGAPPLDLETYDVTDLVAAAPAVTLVPVHKSRRRYTFRGCMAELTDVRTADGSTRTIAVESEDAARVTAAVRELGLDSRPNVSVAAALASELTRRG
jgi:exopolyphosphatase / guanosine-5'-triphosphate,3'-diphosphate pyrophosphatase